MLRIFGVPKNCIFPAGAETTTMAKQKIIHKILEERKRNATTLLMQKGILHYPSLKTVLNVEDVLQKANNPITREELKRKLEKKIMHQTLNIVLKYLEDSGKIIDGRKGIVWIYNPSSKLDKLVKEGVEI
jgi:hypothetical protein